VQPRAVTTRCHVSEAAAEGLYVCGLLGVPPYIQLSAFSIVACMQAQPDESFDIVIGDLADPLDGGPCYQLYTQVGIQVTD
jgi:hypothetical protein